MLKIIQNIWRGDAGLAITFWFYGLFGTTLLGIPLALVTPGSISAVFVVISFCFYLVLINTGIWRAAGKYSGPKIWKVMPRAAIVLTLVAFLIGILATIFIPSTMKNSHGESGLLRVDEKESQFKQVNSELGIREARRILKIPDVLSDESALKVIHDVYYPDMDQQELANRLGVKLTVSKQDSELGVIGRWRYESCQKEAASAPTPQGVNVGLRLCREKFTQ